MNRSASTKRYWRSLNDLGQTTEFKELMANEFQSEPEEEWTQTSRRRFLQLMGASVALATASCRWDQEKLLPVVSRTPGTVPGTPRAFATILNRDGFAEGVMVTSFDGHPTKIEGNTGHPESLGATSATAQAATLGLYDPDRSRSAASYTDGVESDVSVDAVKAALGGIQNSGAGAKVAVLSEPTTSPSIARMKAAFMQAHPSATWVEYSANDRSAEVEGCRLAFNQAARPYYNMADAKIIVALDDDFLTEGPSAVRLTREAAAKRKPNAEWMSRIYSIEANFTVTGGFADHRLPLRSSDIGSFVTALSAKLNGGSAPVLDAKGADAFLDALVDDLNHNKGAAVLTCGPNQPAEVHAHVAALNVQIGALGRTVNYLPATAVGSGMGAVKALVGKMNAGEIENLVILGGNPTFTMPADLEFGAALGKVTNSIHLSEYRDETSRKCSYHMPMAHDLEAWTDGLGADGTRSIGQPLITPLWKGKSACEMISMMLGKHESSMDIVRQTAGLSDSAWHNALLDGIIAGSSATALKVSLASLPDLAPVAEGMELRFTPHFAIRDGRYANLGWLQELPDPMTKLTWDNAALMSFATGKRLGVNHEGMVKLEVNGRTLEVAVYLMPGHADDSITLAYGYGRTDAGHVAGLNDDAIEPVGFNTFSLRGSDAMDLTAVNVTATKGHYRLATTQDHFAMDAIGAEGTQERLPELVKEGSLSEFKKDPLFAKAAADYWGSETTLWQELDKDKVTDHKWGMSIDLASCTGCGNCTIACQSENNVAVVGKEQVLRGREMAWIRMDRYFLGDVENPTAINQPINCAHCELAPCESVCPVAATTHSQEGLNDMVYNRCIGTRYCANNCPYKVRRFNFFNFNKDAAKPGNEVLAMAANPDVTVRSRGVMEKCSFCVQRIERARIDTRNAERETRIQDGVVQVACEQVCPADAITFGDLLDKGSRVLKTQADDRAYKLLPELNNKPRISFLARIRNPHPSLETVAVSEEVVSHG
ncbi:MAG: TAT-variant-translocated molybdopterin oxidoreductase [Planctomycetota bacterium]